MADHDRPVTLPLADYVFDERSGRLVATTRLTQRTNPPITPVPSSAGILASGGSEDWALDDTNFELDTALPQTSMIDSTERRVGDVLSAERFPERVRTLLTTVTTPASSEVSSASSATEVSDSSATPQTSSGVPYTISTDPKTGGQKGVKPLRYELIPTAPMAEVALVYGLGARKYADRNWEKGYDYSKSYSAMQRHLQLYWSGEDWDADGFHHLAAVVFHSLALMEFQRTHPDLDDRPNWIGDSN